VETLLAYPIGHTLKSCGPFGIPSTMPCSLAGVTYEMMEAAWRPQAPTGAWPDGMEPIWAPPGQLGRRRRLRDQTCEGEQ
jgi:hypothetical protein